VPGVTRRSLLRESIDGADRAVATATVVFAFDLGEPTAALRLVALFALLATLAPFALFALFTPLAVFPLVRAGVAADFRSIPDVRFAMLDSAWVSVRDETKLNLRDRETRHVPVPLEWRVVAHLHVLGTHIA
jgi:hypothetical protein